MAFTAALDRRPHRSIIVHAHTVSTKFAYVYHPRHRCLQVSCDSLGRERSQPMPRPIPFARALTLFVVLGMLLAACGAAPAQPGAGATAAPGSSSATAAPAGSAASPQDTLVYAADFSDQISLDPAVV